MHMPFEVTPGARLRIGTRSAGARATLAIRGGIEAERIFGSSATSLISRMGPLGGRALRAGDVLPIARFAGAGAPTARGYPLPLPSGGARVRVIPGPHAEMFTAGGFDMLYGSRFTITPNSNRMGYRLEGPPLLHRGSADILSDATAIGSLQVPASGQPIMLMADRQTTGGYPKIATVITADLPIAGQLAPGDWLEFAACTRHAAIEALKTRRARLEGR
jgi:antagonist of KipI